MRINLAIDGQDHGLSPNVTLLITSQVIQALCYLTYQMRRSRVVVIMKKKKVVFVMIWHRLVANRK